MDGYLFLAIVAISALQVSAQTCGVTPSTSTTCPRQQSGTSCCNWMAEYPNNQTIFSDHTTNFTTDTTCRPLGFLSGTWYYQKPPSIAQPCANIQCTYVNGQCSTWAVVAVQTEARICAQFRVNGVASGSPACQDSSFSLCKSIPGTSASDRVDVDFYCDSNCGESDISFWYRIIQYTPANGQDGNDLCALQPSMFPNDLIQLPVGQDPRNRNPTLAPAATNSATLAHPVSWMLLVSCLAYLLSK